MSLKLVPGSVSRDEKLAERGIRTLSPLLSARDATPAATQVSGHVLTGERCSDPSEVVVTVTHRMILKDELAGKRGIAIERHRRSAIQLFIAKSTYCCCRRNTVACQQGERGFLYPIEIHLAQLFAAGQPISGVTSDAVDAMNRDHAKENDGIGHAGNVMHPINAGGRSAAGEESAQPATGARPLSPRIQSAAATRGAGDAHAGVGLSA
jgi:hypothetical protein